MLRFFFFLLIGYLVLRFVLRFVIPLMRITSQTSARMREMEDRMRGGVPEQPQRGRPTTPKEDYIDYEEVK